MAQPPNTADAKRQKELTQKEKRQQERDHNDLAVLLNIPEGRRFMWRLLGHCGVNRSIWSPSAQIHYNSGMQDVGHFILGEIVAVRPEAFLQMMQEAQKREQEDA